MLEASFKVVIAFRLLFFRVVRLAAGRFRGLAVLCKSTEIVLLNVCEVDGVVRDERVSRVGFIGLPETIFKTLRDRLVPDLIEETAVRVEQLAVNTY
jgi:hypothetical protein